MEWTCARELHHTDATVRLYGQRKTFQSWIPHTPAEAVEVRSLKGRWTSGRMCSILVSAASHRRGRTACIHVHMSEIM